MTTTAIAVPYADKINQQFSKQQSHYVDLDERLQHVLKDNSWLQNVLDSSIEDFQEQFPNYKKWSDVKLCRAETTTLDKIVIDTTLQRLLSPIWVIEILDKFKEFKASAIRVYQDPACPEKYICWDGQHTSILFLIISKMILGEDISNCKVPIVISPSTHKPDIRQSFMSENSKEGKRRLDLIDLFHQMVFGVRTDNSTIPEWTVAEQKQQWLENAKMFATHDKFNDVNMPGAYARMDELMNTKKYQPIITKYFTQYFTAVCLSNRPVQPKESWMLYEYFKLCESDSNINITDKYIRDVAKALQVVGNTDFNSIDLTSRAKVSWQNYYRNYLSPEHNLRGIRYPEKPLGLTFLIAQIAKAGVNVPHYNELYPVPYGDLF